MKVHVIVDFMYLYYKYKFTIESNRIRRLVSDIEWNSPDGTKQMVKTDMSYVYYPIKEIEGFRRTFEKEGNDITVSICFDSPSKRKDVNEEYKSNRTSKLTETDLEQIAIIRKLLTKAGYNVYWVEGYEADDIIANLLQAYQSDFDFNVIYTPDTDLLVHINNHVGVMRYKTGKNYTAISVNNVADYCSQEFKCNIPANGLLLYKILCGDKSDVIKGVRGFGPAAFNRFVDHINDTIDWEKANDVDYIGEFIRESNYFNTDALKEIEDSLNLVGFMPIEEGLEAPSKKSTTESRSLAYLPLQMKSLVD